AFRRFTEIAKEVENGEGLLHRLVYSKNDGDAVLKSLTGAAAGVRELTDGVKNSQGVLHALVYGTKGDQTIDALRESMQHIGEASAELATTLENARSGKGALHTLLYSDTSTDIEDFIRNMRATADNFKQASQALAQGSGTLGALIIDSKLYDNL